ncbi:MAG: DUF4252 domain-containing protein [Muribaculaceae bacterium]|nr:DUF4252 domain-containing protein [Muribaculaceae bacterium]
MKKIISLLILLLTSTSIGFSDSRVFKKYPGGMDVSTVYVSPAAIKLGMSIESDQFRHLKKLIKNPESIEIISTRKPSSYYSMYDDCKNVVKKMNLELILNISDFTDKINIYVGKILNNHEIQDILIETRDERGYTIVYIKGIINSDELLNIYGDSSPVSVRDRNGDTVGIKNRKRKKN